MNLHDSSDNSDFFPSNRRANLGEATRGGHAFLGGEGFSCGSKARARRV